MNPADDGESLEFANPVLHIALRLHRDRDAFHRRVFDHWTMMPSVLLVGTFGVTLVLPRFLVSYSPAWLVTGILLVMLISAWARHYATMRLANPASALRRMAWELRVRPGALADLMTTPLGASEFLQALIYWHERGIRRNAGAWIIAAVLIAPPISNLLTVTPGDIPAFWHPVVTYFTAVAIMRASGSRHSALASVCRLLKDMRLALAGSSTSALSGDPTSEDAFVHALGCAAIGIVPMTGFLLAIPLDMIFSGIDSDVLSQYAISLSALLMGLLQGALLSSMRRQAQLENRRAMLVHMEAVLVEIREAAARDFSR